MKFNIHSSGHGRAARFLALTLMYSTMNMLLVPERYPLKVVEAAGRNVGWLTAASALANR